MNIKGLMLAATLIGAPVGATAATISAKNKKADVQTTQTMPEYQLSAQDYYTFIIPQITKKLTQKIDNPDNYLPLASFVEKYSAIPAEKRDSMINETTTKSLAIVRDFDDKMDSIKNEAVENRDAVASRFDNKKYKTSDLDYVLNTANNDCNKVMNLIDEANNIDRAVNNQKATEFDIEMNYSDITQNILGMTPEEFKNKYETELSKLKDKEIPFIEPIPSPYMLTEKERFVLDKVTLLEEALNQESIINYLKIENNTIQKSDKTIDDVYSALVKLHAFNRNLQYSTFVDFVTKESPIVVISFLKEVLNEIDNETGVDSVTSDIKKPAIRKYTDGSKVIIEVTNPDDNSVKRYTTNGVEVK